MSKLRLIEEIYTICKMTSSTIDEVKLKLYLDEILSNYTIETTHEQITPELNLQYINLFINSLKIENYSSGTLENYRYELLRFSEFLNKSILTTKTPDVRNYLAAHPNLKTSTVVSKLDRLSSFFGWLVIEEELLKNPCAKIKRPKLPKRVRQGLTIVELEQVRNSCNTLMERALIEAFYSTGCRLDELRKVNIDDIDWQSNSLLVIGKGNKERRVYLSEKAVWYIRKYLKTREDDCPALFASTRKPIRRMTNHGIAFYIRKIKEQSNIDKPLTPHIMRHTFAQLSLDNGMEVADLQALMGHESADTTARYAVVNEERKQSAFRKFHAQ